MLVDHSRRSRRALIAIATTVIAANCVDLGGACVNDQLSEVPSPDGVRRAVVFERNCGGTTPFSTQVSVLPTGVTLPDSGGNVFVADTDRGRAPAATGGGPRVAARWLAPDTLEIRYDPRARIFLHELRGSGAAVRFVADSVGVR